MTRRSLFFSIACVLFLASPARASPPRTVATSDALADGDVDAEDLVARATVGRGAPRTPPGGHAWVSLVGFSRPSAISDRRDVGGMLVVGLPLDRIARPSLRASAIDPTPALETRRVAVEGGDAALALTPHLARAVVAQAWRASGIGVDDSRLDAIVSRARWSAVLPETRLRAIRYDGATTSMYLGSTDTATLRDSAGANVGLEARVTWHLDRLLYADDEPSFERMKLERHDARARIAARTLEALFQWQRSWLDLQGVPAAERGTREEVDAALRVLEAEAALDVLTGGWFSSWRARRVVLVVPQTEPTAHPDALPHRAPGEL